MSNVFALAEIAFDELAIKYRLSFCIPTTVTSSVTVALITSERDRRLYLQRGCWTVYTEIDKLIPCARVSTCYSIATFISTDL